MQAYIPRMIAAHVLSSRHKIDNCEDYTDKVQTQEALPSNGLQRHAVLASMYAWLNCVAAVVVSVVVKVSGSNSEW